MKRNTKISALSLRNVAYRKSLKEHIEPIQKSNKKLILGSIFRDMGNSRISRKKLHFAQENELYLYVIDFVPLYYEDKDIGAQIQASKRLILETKTQTLKRIIWEINFWYKTPIVKQFIKNNGINHKGIFDLYRMKNLHFSLGIWSKRNKN